MNAQPTMAQPELRHVCDLFVDLDPIREMGAGQAGQRRIIPIIGGWVEGPDVTGKILNLGADWQTIWSNGVAELDTRYAIETNDGAIIEIRNYGYRHGPQDVIAAIARGEEVAPNAYYMRTHARLESGDPRYAWVNRTLFVGTGARKDGQVVVSLFAID
ncbi:hypothetical protein TG4357_01227 [Thalassovita gelatinovora]|uniref:UPF0311 protein TG4357_01227 n=1 Tax=Thalassovita gelatinovora TaxID=53501 RepID=A0A0P1F8A9_THAGE|nr:DUF3237 domain-containing protein [Thalassovita gelatinovora]CUH64350.1 hypothetical protein TG4357_01227 [Thalassovita gelatinovora]SEQ92892.1 Protein of unknown function [Thalassovita gelatinovora]